MADYITFASIESVAYGTTDRMLIGPPTSSETFPDLPSFGSSILLRKRFYELHKILGGRRDWRRWLLLLGESNNEAENAKSIDAKLLLAPVTVELSDKQLGTAVSAFEKQRVVILGITQDKDDSPLQLLDIELVQEL